MFKGICPECGSINDISFIGIESCNFMCNTCNYIDSFRVFSKIKKGDILEIENKVYLVKDDGLYKLKKEDICSGMDKIKRLGNIKSNPEFFFG